MWVTIKEKSFNSTDTEALLVANYPVSRAQLDALWTYIENKGEKGGEASKRPEAASGGVELLP